MKSCELCKTVFVGNTLIKLTFPDTITLLITSHIILYIQQHFLKAAHLQILCLTSKLSSLEVEECVFPIISLY